MCLFLLLLLRFILRHADADLNLLLEQTVPPIDLSRVAIFRAAIGKFDKQAGSDTVNSQLWDHGYR